MRKHIKMIISIVMTLCIFATMPVYAKEEELSLIHISRILEALASKDILLLMSGFKIIGDREGFWRHISGFSQDELAGVELAFARHPRLREALDLKEATAYKAYRQLQEIKKGKKYEPGSAVYFNWIETADFEEFI